MLVLCAVAAHESDLSESVRESCLFGNLRELDLQSVRRVGRAVRRWTPGRLTLYSGDQSVRWGILETTKPPLTFGTLGEIEERLSGVEVEPPPKQQRQRGPPVAELEWSAVCRAVGGFRVDF